MESSHRFLIEESVNEYPLYLKMQDNKTAFMACTDDYIRQPELLQTAIALFREKYPSIKKSNVTVKEYKTNKQCSSCSKHGFRLRITAVKLLRKNIIDVCNGCGVHSTNDYGVK